MAKKALILGINGQDGSFLADILISKGYEVHGLVRRNSQPNLWRIQHCLDKITLHQGDLLDPVSVQEVFYKVAPNEVYNEADQDHVSFSTSTPSYSAAVTYGAVANLLEMLKPHKSVKLFQPLSATMFGNAPAPQSLETPFDPQSPYAVAKVAAYYLCKHYREKHGVQVYTAILYNHDSVRRQGDYLLHHICKAAVKIAHEDQESLTVDNPNLRVDIGSAQEYMEICHKLMQLPDGIDIVLGTGFSGSIHSFIQSAFDYCTVPWLCFKKTKEGNTFPHMEADTSQVTSLLDTKPKISIYTLIPEICDYYTDTLYGGK